LNHVKVDYRVPLAEIAALLATLTRQRAEALVAPAPFDLDAEVRIAKGEHPMEAGLEHIAKPSAFACPDCHGVLLQLSDQNRLRFRCHTGHAYSLDSLLAAYSEKIEEALWNAIRSLEEAGLFLDTLTTHVRDAHSSTGSERFAERADQARRDSAALREIVNAREPLVGEAMK